MVERADRTVGERPIRGLPIGIAGVTVPPLRRPGHIRERSSVLSIGIELRLVGDDQSFVRSDRPIGILRRQGKRA